MTSEFNSEKLRRAVRQILESIGEDAERQGLRDTPQRIADMYAELFQGLGEDPVTQLQGAFEEGGQELVMVRDTPFYSMCEHHLLPFYGVAHVGYIPSGRIVGVSKIARVVDGYARRPQLQERLTSQIADCMMKGLRPAGVAVVISAEHFCIAMRGVRKPGSRVVTSATRGDFRESPLTRAELLSLVQGK